MLVQIPQRLVRSQLKWSIAHSEDKVKKVSPYTLKDQPVQLSCSGEFGKLPTSNNAFGNQLRESKNSKVRCGPLLTTDRKKRAPERLMVVILF